VRERTLRIVAGAWRNRRLVIAPGSRPTAERAREAFFDILGDWIVGKRVLELYAGSALSRSRAPAARAGRRRDRHTPRAQPERPGRLTWSPPQSPRARRELARR
jgi:hypothetical protein